MIDNFHRRLMMWRKTHPIVDPTYFYIRALGDNQRIKPDIRYTKYTETSKNAGIMYVQYRKNGIGAFQYWQDSDEPITLNSGEYVEFCAPELYTGKYLNTTATGNGAGGTFYDIPVTNFNADFFPDGDGKWELGGKLNSLWDPQMRVEDMYVWLAYDKYSNKMAWQQLVTYGKIVMPDGKYYSPYISPVTTTNLYYWGLIAKEYDCKNFYFGNVNAEWWGYSRTVQMCYGSSGSASSSLPFTTLTSAVPGIIFKYNYNTSSTSAYNARNTALLNIVMDVEFAPANIYVQSTIIENCISTLYDVSVRFQGTKRVYGGMVYPDGDKYDNPVYGHTVEYEQPTLSCSKFMGTSPTYGMTHFTVNVAGVGLGNERSRHYVSRYINEPTFKYDKLLALEDNTCTLVLNNTQQPLQRKNGFMQAIPEVVDVRGYNKCTKVTGVGAMANSFEGHDGTAQPIRGEFHPWWEPYWDFVHDPTSQMYKGYSDPRLRWVSTAWTNGAEFAKAVTLPEMQRYGNTKYPVNTGVERYQDATGKWKFRGGVIEFTKDVKDISTIKNWTYFFPSSSTLGAGIPMGWLIKAPNMPVPQHSIEFTRYSYLKDEVLWTVGSYNWDGYVSFDKEHWYAVRLPNGRSVRMTDFMYTVRDNDGEIIYQSWIDGSAISYTFQGKTHIYFSGNNNTSIGGSVPVFHMIDEYDAIHDTDNPNELHPQYLLHGVDDNMPTLVNKAFDCLFKGCKMYDSTLRKILDGLNEMPADKTKNATYVSMFQDVELVHDEYDRHVLTFPSSTYPTAHQSMFQGCNLRFWCCKPAESMPVGGNTFTGGFLGEIDLTGWFESGNTAFPNLRIKSDPTLWKYEDDLGLLECRITGISAEMFKSKVSTWTDFSQWVNLFDNAYQPFYKVIVPNDTFKGMLKCEGCTQVDYDTSNKTYYVVNNDYWHYGQGIGEGGKSLIFNSKPLDVETKMPMGTGYIQHECFFQIAATEDYTTEIHPTFHFGDMHNSITCNVSTMNEDGSEGDLSHVLGYKYTDDEGNEHDDTYQMWQPFYRLFKFENTTSPVHLYGVLIPDYPEDLDEDHEAMPWFEQMFNGLAGGSISLPTFRGLGKSSSFLTQRGYQLDTKGAELPCKNMWTNVGNVQNNTVDLYIDVNQYDQTFISLMIKGEYLIRPSSSPSNQPAINLHVNQSKIYLYAISEVTVTNKPTTLVMPVNAPYGLTDDQDCYTAIKNGLYAETPRFVTNGYMGVPTSRPAQQVLLNKRLDIGGTAKRYTFYRFLTPIEEVLKKVVPTGTNIIVD